MSEPIALLDLVSPEGDLDLERLVAAVAEGPVVVGTLTDEELHWLGPDPDAVPRSTVDAPRLGQLGPEEQQAALDAAFALLLARGELALDDDRPGEVLRLGHHALAVALRAEADARATFTLRRDGREGRLLVFRLPGVGTLLDEIDGRGLHDLTLCAAEVAAGAVAATLDAEVPGTGEVQRAATGDALVPPLDELRAAARTELHAVLATSDGKGGGHLRQLLLLAGPGGTYVVRGHAGGDASTEVVLQPVAPGDVPALLAAFLTAASAPGDVPVGDAAR